MIDEDALRRMSPEERSALARALAAIDIPHPMSDPVYRRRRRIALLAIMACCLLLIAWIVILTQTLPRDYRATHWRGAWVGLDVAELGAFALAWVAAWRQRQILIFFMVVAGTLLLADAWFDVVLSYGSSGFMMSLLSALLVEIPLALVLYAGARRLVRLTVDSMMRLEGVTGPVPPLWRVPLFADGLEEALPHRLRRLGMSHKHGASGVTR